MTKIAETFEAEIAKLVTDWDAEGKELVPSFISKALVDRHLGGLARANEHTPFFEHYTYKGVRQHVGAFIAKAYGDKEDEDGETVQQTLPGFEHLQRRYVIKRNDEEVAILIENMTDAELRTRARMLRGRGKSCLAHADEIERFISVRQSQLSA